MIDRSKAFWAWVWDDSFQPSDKRRELVIDTFGNDDECIVADDPTAYLEVSGHYTTTWWNHYKRIPEQEKRLMTREEILGFIAWNPHTVIRYNNGVANPITTLAVGLKLEKYDWAPITEAGEIGEWSKFYITEVEDDN